MFRSTDTPVVEPSREVAPPADLIPLSHLALDLPTPVEGWPDYLGRRAIAFVGDDLGRDCVRRQDARRLLDEQRSDELRAAKRRKAAEAAAVEADRVRRAQIWRGLPAVNFPVGVSASTAMLAAAKDSEPRRQSPLQEALAGESLTFHPFTQSEDE